MDVTDVQINEALALLWKRKTTYQEYESYFLGDHRLGFATEKFNTAFGQLFKAFSDNLCPAVVEAAESNLRIVGFTSEGETDEQRVIAELAWTLWKTLRLGRVAEEIHNDALVLGESYLIVWPDDSGLPQVNANPPDLVAVIYDDDRPDQLIWAAKVWKPNVDKETWNVTFYWPDRAEKYTYRGSGPPTVNKLKQRILEGEPWPLFHNMGRVPVIHFRHGGRIGGHGRSLLKHMIPLQDALNKAVADMLVSMEYVALPQRWATGLEVELDPQTGKPAAPFQPGIDRVWSVAAPDARFGQFEPADLSQFIQVQEGFRLEIARVTGTPLHYLMLDDRQVPSGEALKVLQDRFIQRSADRQESFGNSWEDAMVLVLTAAGVIVPEAPMLGALWAEVAPRGEREAVETALLKRQVGVSKHKALLELGYTAEEITEMEAQNEADLNTLGEELLREFEHGGDE